MEYATSDYEKFFRIGEMAVVIMSLDGGVINEVYGAIAQLSDVGAEMVLASYSLPKAQKGKEISATLTAITGHLRCECPVMIGRNSFDKTLILRFTGNAVVKLQRQHLRCDVLIPFLYSEEGKDINETEKKWKVLRSDPKRATFRPVPYGESFMAAQWQGKGDILPSRINLGGGGVRFTTSDEIRNGSTLSVQVFIEAPQPRVIHGVMEVTRSELFHLTHEDKAFYNYAKIRLKSQTICITAGRYIMIDEGDREVVMEYIRSRHGMAS